MIEETKEYVFKTRSGRKVKFNVRTGKIKQKGEL